MASGDRCSVEVANGVLERLVQGAPLHDVVEEVSECLRSVLSGSAVLVVLERRGSESEPVSDPRLSDDVTLALRTLGKRLSNAGSLPGTPFGPQGAPIGVWIDTTSHDPASQPVVEAIGRAGFRSLWAVPVRDPLAGHVGWLFACLAEARQPEPGEFSLLTMATRFLCLAARQEGTMQQQASGDYDSLTGLPGREVFLKRLGAALARHQRRQGRVGVIVLDFDRFRVIHNSLGVAAGNQVLLTVARRLRQSLRWNDTLARLERDEFAILLEGLQCEQDAIEVTERMMQCLHRPITVTNREVMLTASFGIALSTERSTAADLMREAEFALADARSSGGGQYRVFSQALDQGIRWRMELEIDLLHALERNQFHLKFQPVIELDTGRIVELEALLRWEHPKYGSVSPSEFIPIAEGTGAIILIGRWTLREAARLMREWLNRFPHLSPDLKLSINLSPRQLRYSGLVQDIVTTLAEVDLPPSRLKVEITETSLVDIGDAVLSRLEQLRALGIELALDDFGTGYSSLGYLAGLPVDCLKIDRTFIERLGRDQAQAAIIQTIVSVARALGLGVVGEGIETEKQLVHLRALGCTRGQGYYIARPLCPDRIAALLEHGPTILHPFQNRLEDPSELLAS